jgi:hypothetical protein
MKEKGKTRNVKKQSITKEKGKASENEEDIFENGKLQ